MLQTDFSKEIMLSRYAYPGETSWDEIVERVASHVSKVELNGEVLKWKKEFYDIIQPGDFIPGGRILYGSGRRNGSLLNCFVLGVDDNRHSIAKLVHDMYLISTGGGGIGVSYSKIRPKGDPIQNIDGSAPGVISEIRKIDAVGEQIKSGGGRRTALLALLSIEHPDILEFINVKTNLNELNNHNISIAVTRKFIRAVKKNRPWKFYFGNKEYKLWEFIKTNPDGRRKEERIIVPGVTKERAEVTANAFYKQHFNDIIKFVDEKELIARDLWHNIISNNLKSGEPGFIFIDNIEENFNANYFEGFVSTNPCVAGNTKIITDRGVLRIDECIERYKSGEVIKVLSYDIDTQENELQVILWGDKTKTDATTITLEIEDEKAGKTKKIECTPDHEVYTKNRGKIQAKDLTINDDIITV